MREILFRGMNESKQMIEGYFFQSWKECFILWGTTNGVPNMTKIDPATVGQYTGLCDKNGVKIFEGDVIESVDDGTVGAREWNAAFGKHHEICWVKQDMQDFFGTVYVGFEIPLCAHSEYMAVIGNIHDNPELVGEESK